MTPTEINKALALAIGYLPEHVRVTDDGTVRVCRPLSGAPSMNWYEFDFNDGRITIAMIERYKIAVEPHYSSKMWRAVKYYGGAPSLSRSLREVVAWVVIRGAGK